MRLLFRYAQLHLLERWCSSCSQQFFERTAPQFFRASRPLMTRRRWIADIWSNNTASITGAQAEHLARVLRAQPGAEADIVVDGFVYRAVIASVSREEVRFDLMEELSAASALPITLLLSVFKFDRMEWAIEKATELGVAAIVPILARRTEKHLAQAASKRAERWRRIAHEAAKQSRRTDIPIIDEPIALEKRLQAIDDSGNSTLRILLSEIELDISLSSRFESALKQAVAPKRFEMALGPEGGWTPEELALFATHHWQSASLGTRILRVETAAIAALAVAASVLEEREHKAPPKS